MLSNRNKMDTALVQELTDFIQAVLICAQGDEDLPYTFGVTRSDDGLINIVAYDKSSTGKIPYQNHFHDLRITIEEIVWTD